MDLHDAASLYALMGHAIDTKRMITDHCRDLVLSDLAVTT